MHIRQLEEQLEIGEKTRSEGRKEGKGPRDKSCIEAVSAERRAEAKEEKTGPHNVNTGVLTEHCLRPTGHNGVCDTHSFLGTHQKNGAKAISERPLHQSTVCVLQGGGFTGKDKHTVTVKGGK